MKKVTLQSERKGREEEAGPGAEEVGEGRKSAAHRDKN